MGSATIIGCGTSLQHAENNAVAGFIDGAEGMQLRVPHNAIDFAYMVQVLGDCGNTVIAVQAQQLTTFNT
jgi:hypothetical protein